MILGSDSHSRYGALGTMGIGEGGGEVAKQLLGRTYDIAYPPVLPYSRGIPCMTARGKKDTKSKPIRHASFLLLLRRVTL